jgi:ABC-type antimicrobial peptide transport system permease subunit
MTALRLGYRNLMRNRPRFLLVAALIAVPFFLVLVLQAVGESVVRHTDLLKRTVDNALQLRARGSMGHVNMVGSFEILPQAVFEKAKTIEGVARIEPYLLAMSPTEGHNFAMHVGLVPGDTMRLESHGEAGSPTIVAGRALVSEDAGKDVAVIGQRYAAWAGITPDNLDRASLTIDATRTHPVIFALDRPKRTLRIVGIYASGYVFGDMQLFLPLDTFRDLYGVPEGLSWLFVRATSSDRLAAVERDLRAAAGDLADIIGPTAVAEFERMTTGAVLRLSAVGTTLGAVLMAVIVFFVMLLVVRQRGREIGTLKAIGAPNRPLVGAFLTEAVLLCFAGAILGTLAFVAVGGPVAYKAFAVGIAPFLPAEYKDTLVATLYLPARVGLAQIPTLLALCLAVALAGSSLGLIKLVRLSPLEAMRHE